MFGGLLDEAIELKKNPENDVLFAYCGGINEMCIKINESGSSSLCKFCSKCTHKILEQYGIESIPLSKYLKGTKVSFDYENADELRKIKYRDVQIGLSIMSNLISSTRNLNPLIDSETKKYFDAHLQQNVRFVDSLYSLIEEFMPDVIYSFNGRFEEVRPLYDICVCKKIKCVLSEIIFREGRSQKVQFIDNLPHDIKYNLERRNYCWDNYKMTEEQKLALGHSFFKKRRNGEESGDIAIYVAGQKEGNFSGFDKSKINIAIFNSSEDEFAAVGGDWDALKVFSTQLEGIEYLLKNADPRIHFYIRVHPHLKTIPYKYHKELYKLPEKYNNVTVIPANSDASTYTIMENCDKVVCFGSTMGMESAYWGKPSILLGPSMYYYDDVAYTPKSKEEALELLVKPLEVKKNLQLLKYGAYYLDTSPLILDEKNIDCRSFPHKLLGKEYHSAKYINFMGGEILTAIYIALNRYFKQKKGPYTIPLIEA